MEQELYDKIYQMLLDMGYRVEHTLPRDEAVYPYIHIGSSSGQFSVPKPPQILGNVNINIDFYGDDTMRFDINNMIILVYNELMKGYSENTNYKYTIDMNSSSYSMYESISDNNTLWVGTINVTFNYK